MRLLELSEYPLVSAGNGYFKIIVNGDVPADCAAFIIQAYEKFLVGDYNADDAMKAIFSSTFSTHDIENALNGLEVVFWV